jgi:Reverse transcriptase (RNA-dependent DNA polymerase)
MLRKIELLFNFLWFIISKDNHSLFCKFNNHDITIILVYVDDIIVMENNLDEIRDVKRKLKENFNIKDLGVLKFFIDTEIVYSPKDIFISQRKYILDLSKEIGKLG